MSAGDGEGQPPDWQKPQWEKKDDEPPPSLRKDEEEQPPLWQQQPQQPQWQQPQPQQQQPPWGAPQGQHQQPWAPPAQPQWQQQQWQPSPPTPGSATAALILGIVGVLFCPLIGGPLALVFGYKARSQINASNGDMGGGGLAMAGIILGWIGVAFLVLAILGIIAIIAADGS